MSRSKQVILNRSVVQTYLRAALGFAIALAAGGFAVLAKVPVPWLLGALLASLALGVVGRRPGFPNPIRDAAFLLLGYLIGSTASSEFFANVTQWIPSVVAGLILIPAITFSSALVIHRMTDLTPDEALLCSVPGSLPFVVAASEDLGLRTHIVMMFQSVRLLTLTFLLPFMLSLLFVVPDIEIALGTATEATVQAPWWQQSGIMVLALGFAVLCAWVAGLFKVPAPTFIGPMMGVALAKLAGVPLPDLPPLLLFGSQAALGWIMGARFDAIPFRELRRMAIACMCGLATGVSVALLACGILIATTDLDLRALILALAPGAIETVTSIAIEEGVDPLFVSTHQIARMLSIPIIAAGMLVVGRRVFQVLKRP